MFDWFTLIIIAFAAVIVIFIIKAVRQTKAEIDQKLKGVDPAKRDEVTMKLVEKIRSQDVRCTRCGRQTHNVWGTTNKYKCDSCNHEFEGPPNVLSEMDG